AMMMCWFLGSSSSEAIYDLLFGKVSPSGKLPMSFPRNVGQIPVYYNHFNTGRPYIEKSNNMYVSKYLDVENTPLYPFGYGLSYAKFRYENLSVSKKVIKKSDILDVNVEVFNDSEFSAKEVVQLYIRDFVADIVRPIKELKQFQKVLISGKTSLTLQFKLSVDDLSYINEEGNKCVESGRFAIYIGGSSDKYIEAEVYLDMEE
ncbi:MAG: glycoside hydrolase family 3 C-terminal domain-containing protein, partial [Candidatus Izemoplasmatales bacterium]|nr:glycoside hydrolase family 3 C-terminal domain-containing protein [Candidatus Izemoplasmatales bacterium]